jgi:protein gp37
LTGKIGKVDLQGIEVAGPVPETWGPNPRHAKQEWIDEIELQCKQQGVRLFEANWIAGSK